MANTPAHCSLYHDQITVKVTRLPAWGVAYNNARSIQLSIDRKTNKTNGFGPSAHVMSRYYYCMVQQLYSLRQFLLLIARLSSFPRNIWQLPFSERGEATAEQQSSVLGLEHNNKLENEFSTSRNRRWAFVPACATPPISSVERPM